MKFIVIAFTLSLFAACSSDSDSGPSGVTPPAGQVEAAQADQARPALVDLVNRHRLSLGLVPLVETAALENEIQDHTDDMADGRRAFGHAGMSDRCAHARSDLGGGNACGEIVARGQDDVQGAFDAWLGSSGHKARMEDPRYNRVGVGIAIDGDGRPYWGMLFLQR